MNVHDRATRDAAIDRARNRGTVSIPMDQVWADAIKTAEAVGDEETLRILRELQEKEQA